jgi:CheY-like chemotaxis protein
MSSRLRRIAENESNFRDRNERIRSTAGENELVAFVCECSHPDCETPIMLTVEEYEHVRGTAARFAVLGEHVVEDAESLIQDFGRYVVVEKHAEGRTVAEERDPRNHLKTCRVLVVDDIFEVRLLLKMLIQLEPNCSVVAEAANGAEAVEAAREVKPEVVILDLQMPVMDGYDALPLILEVVPTTKVIVYTAAGTFDERRLANLGAFNIVAKGGDPGVLIAAIKEVALSGAARSEHLRTAAG